MLKRRREDKAVHCLRCWRCHSYTGPNRYALRDGGAVCGMCEDRNPLGNLVRLPIALLSQPLTISVAFTRPGGSAHALHPDLNKALGPWVNFASGEVLRKGLVYLGMTPDELTIFEDAMRRWGQGSGPLTLMPHRKNLLRVDYSLLL